MSSTPPPSAAASLLQGAFTLPAVALLASGTGIVPMLSVLRELYAADKFGVRVRCECQALAPAEPTRG